MGYGTAYVLVLKAFTLNFSAWYELQKKLGMKTEKLAEDSLQIHSVW